jgi:hypothetical protein
MSTSPPMVFQIALVAGQIAWKISVINLLMQNKPVVLELGGYPAAVIANALKVPLPKIATERQKMTAVMVFVIAVITIVLVQPLVDVLNKAFSRNYKVWVRHRKRGAGIQDDGLTFELIPS